jgi:glutamyl-tRNA reductase
MTLAIVNREPTTQPIPPGSPTWRTCLREVSFTDAQSRRTDARTRGLHLTEGEAYRFLLEILCGLQSPMLGETQIMGQFKSFLGALGRDEAWLNRLGQRLLTDAREVRTKHLQGLGSRSYGSAVRRFVSGARHAVIIGTGKLAAEVLPFLADDGRTVDQWGRSDEGVSTGYASLTYRTLDQVSPAAGTSVPTTLVIAAPVASDVVDRIAALYPTLQFVVDLRGETGSDPLQVNAPVVTLQDLFNQMEAANKFAASRVAAARSDIAARSRQYALREELRPFGWDDLCA